MIEQKIRDAFEKNYPFGADKLPYEFDLFVKGYMALLNELDPVAYLLSNKEFNHYPVVKLEKPTDWHISWVSEPIYRLPEGVNRD